VGESYTISNSDVTLYAQWGTPFTVSYNSAGSTGTVPSDAAVYYYGDKATVRDKASLARSRYVFNGWKSGGVKYAPSAEITMTQSLTLSADWVTTDVIFNAQKTTNAAWYNVTGVRLAIGEHCIIYAQDSAGISEADAQEIVAEYEAYIHKQAQSTFGTFRDVDGNGKVIFLLLDIIDSYSPGKNDSYVAGYFSPYHMYNKAAGAPYSNGADMLFMDTNPGFSPANRTSFYSTMAHEFQHLINFSQTVANNRSAKDLWINEGLSSAAEYVYYNAKGGTSGLHDTSDTSNIAYYNADPMGTIANGNNFFVWNGYWENLGDSVANYATAYLFFQWLRIHASNDMGIYKSIIDSTYSNHTAVVNAAASYMTKPADVSSWTWTTLLRSWMLANFINNSSSVYGYKGQISPVARGFQATNGYKHQFSPGEGIFSIIPQPGYYTVPKDSGTNIKYVGISGNNLDTLDPYTGAALLTFNANTNIQGTDEGGYLANTVGYAAIDLSVRVLSPDVRGSVATPPLPSRPHPIDVHFRPDGTLEK
jgi:hypothetical protein